MMKHKKHMNHVPNLEGSAASSIFQHLSVLSFCLSLIAVKFFSCYLSLFSLFCPKSFSTASITLIYSVLQSLAFVQRGGIFVVLKPFKLSTVYSVIIRPLFYVIGLSCFFFLFFSHHLLPIRRLGSSQYTNSCHHQILPHETLFAQRSQYQGSNSAAIHKQETLISATNFAESPALTGEMRR